MEKICSKHTEIENKLIELELNLSNILEMRRKNDKQILEEITEIKQDIKQIKKLFYGNGKGGLFSRVEKLEFLVEIFKWFFMLSGAWIVAQLLLPKMFKG